MRSRKQQKEDLLPICLPFLLIENKDSNSGVWVRLGRNIIRDFAVCEESSYIRGVGPVQQRSGIRTGSFETSFVSSSIWLN